MRSDEAESMPFLAVPHSFALLPGFCNREFIRGIHQKQSYPLRSV